MARPHGTGGPDGLPSRQGVYEHTTDSGDKPLTQSTDIGGGGGATYENKPVLRVIFHLHSVTVKSG
jgi:hypothetical protein